MKVHLRPEPKERERYVAEPTYAQNNAELSNGRRNSVSKVSIKGVVFASILVIAVIVLVLFLISIK